MTTEVRFLDNPRVMAAMKALAKAIEVSCQGHGGELKSMILAVQSTLGGAGAFHGCRCDRCIAAVRDIAGDVADEQQKPDGSVVAASNSALH